MRLFRARSAWFLAVFLAACGGQAAFPTDGSDDTSSMTNADAGTSRWVPVPLTPEPQWPADDDPNFKPVSIKMPPSSHVDAGTSSSDVGAIPPPPPDVWGPPMMNDIDNPEIATVCADRKSATGSFAFTPTVSRISESAHVSITRDLTEHRWGDAIYRTSFTLFFRSAAVYDDADYGATRRETVFALNVHLNSSVSHPDAFTDGEPQPVEIGWSTGDPRFECGRDGYSTYWSDAEALPYQHAIVTLTRRDATGVAGTIDIENGQQTLTFDAPFGEPYPGAEGICCLK